MPIGDHARKICKCLLGMMGFYQTERSSCKKYADIKQHRPKKKKFK